jgi:hypothetical protein
MDTPDAGGRGEAVRPVSARKVYGGASTSGALDTSLALTAILLPTWHALRSGPAEAAHEQIPSTDRGEAAGYAVCGRSLPDGPACRQAFSTLGMRSSSSHGPMHS